MGWSSSPYEEHIWDLLLAAIGNEFGVAGLMGNLYAESGLYAQIIESSRSASNPVNAYYAEQVNNGTVSRNEFASYPDGYNSLGWYYYTVGRVKHVQIPDYGAFGKGWGLAQWTTADRKEKMYDRCYPNIGSVDLQVSFLIWELQNDYRAVWNTLVNASSISEASHKVLFDFESPPDPAGEESTRLYYSTQIYLANTGRPPLGNLRYGAVRDVLRRLIIHA